MVPNKTETGIKNNALQGVDIPPVIFGTSALGNLFVAKPYEEKLEIVKECVNHSKGIVVFDSAGKYGAGLALETLGKCLKELNVKQEDVIISNKLGWVRTKLETEEPTFESGVWKDLEYDAVQKISYDGIIECFEQGNQLLNGYIPQMVSVHDPDEYLAAAKDEQHAKQLYEDILDAYEALYDLKQQGKVQAIGVGAKNWKTIQRIAKDVDLDWVMIANSMTIKKHPEELLQFMQELEKKGVLIVNSAVFHSGFLIGTDYFDYKLIQPDTPANKELFEWRDKFFNLCKQFSVKPAEACVQFALHAPGVKSIALNTSEAKRVKQNVEMANKNIPVEFWQALKAEGLIHAGFINKTEVKL
jgi:D-threo-aldose 1-dehydrogenase